MSLFGKDILPGLAEQGEDGDADIPQGTARYSDPHDPHYGEYNLLIRNANKSQSIPQHMD